MRKRIVIRLLWVDETGGGVIGVGLTCRAAATGSISKGTGQWVRFSQCVDNMLFSNRSYGDGMMRTYEEGTMK